MSALNAPLVLARRPTNPPTTHRHQSLNPWEKALVQEFGCRTIVLAGELITAKCAITTIKNPHDHAASTQTLIASVATGIFYCIHQHYQSRITWTDLHCLPRYSTSTKRRLRMLIASTVAPPAIITLHVASQQLREPNRCHQNSALICAIVTTTCGLSATLFKTGDRHPEAQRGFSGKLRGVHDLCDGLAWCVAPVAAHYTLEHLKDPTATDQDQALICCGSIVALKCVSQTLLLTAYLVDCQRISDRYPIEYAREMQRTAASSAQGNHTPRLNAPPAPTELCCNKYSHIALSVSKTCFTLSSWVFGFASVYSMLEHVQESDRPHENSAFDYAIVSVACSLSAAFTRYCAAH